MPTLRGKMREVDHIRDGSGLKCPIPDKPHEAWLIYDGECPFCSAYVKYLRLRDSVGTLHLVNARDDDTIVTEVIGANLDLNEGMVLKIGNHLYHGRDCIHVLALLTSPSNLFNRINAAVFRSYRLSCFLYPVLRAGRNATLRLLGRSKVSVTHLRGTDPLR